MPIPETQVSVSAWCNEHYPEESLSQQFANLVEEVVELGRVVPTPDGLGIPEASIANTVSLTVAKSHDTVGDPAALRKEVGDFVIAVFHIATSLGFDVQEALDDVMRVNRLRPVAESRAQAERKRQLGLIG